MKRLLGVAATESRLCAAGAGILLMAGGFWMAWPPLALIVPGGLLACVAIAGAWRETRRAR